MALIIPAGETMMPPGRYQATLDELRAMFVDGAPFTDERRLILRAFELWIVQFKRTFPTVTTLWVNGGFVTHKLWAAPEDIDVIALIDQATYNAAAAAASTRPWELFTQFIGGDKVHPMGGYVDAYVCNPADPMDMWKWHHFWMCVTDKHKTVVPSVYKGYVEVTI